MLQLNGKRTLAWCALALATITAPAGASNIPRSVQALMASGKVVVVAHRGCHNPGPRHGFGAVPENSLLALEQCVKLGVDMMETDVRRTADGELVMIHDDTVDRTTTGTGNVSQLSLASLRKLRLRGNLGGAAAGPTDQRMVTLAEMLAAAKGRIFLNLDIKDAIYPEVIAAVEKAGMTNEVIVKTSTGPTTPPLASMTPYDRVPFIPVLLNSDGRADLGAVASQQVSGGKRPVGFELPQMTEAQFEAVALVSKRTNIPLWHNTLWEGFIPEWGGDIQALRDPDAVWGKMLDRGIHIFQTDEPEALAAFREKRGGR